MTTLYSQNTPAFATFASNNCPKCGSTLKLVAWRAPVGFDPKMKKYACPNGHFESYRIPKHARDKRLIV